MTACEPVIETAVRLKFGLAAHPRAASSSPAEDEACDVVGDAYAATLRWLQSVRRSPEAAGVESFTSYLHGMVRHTFYDWLRRKYPERHRLKSRLRSLASGDTPVSGFAMWQSAEGKLLFGFSEWQGRESRMTARFKDWLSDPASLPQQGPASHSELPLPALIAHVLNWIESPIDVDQLVNGLAHLLGIKAAAVEPLDEEHIAPLPEPAPEIADQIADRVDAESAVPALVEEMCALPPRQFQALVLGLEQDEAALVLTVATPSRVATLLGCPAEALGQLLHEAPLPDLEIASRLGLRRQQVINLRKCARERLARRLAVARADISEG